MRRHCGAAGMAGARAWGAACNGGISMRTGAAGAKRHLHPHRRGGRQRRNFHAHRRGGADAGIMPASPSSSGSADAA